MEIDTIGGIPAHPLFVHLPVVMLPLAAVGAVLIAIRRSWLERFGWWVVGASGIGFIGAVLAAGSGEALEERVRETAALEEHAEMGETARMVAFLFFAVTLGIMLFVRWQKRQQPARTTSRAVGAVMSALLVIGGVAATITVVDAGHQGATVTWGDLEKVDEGDGD